MICYVNKKDIIYALFEKIIDKTIEKNSLKIAFEILYQYTLNLH